MQTKLSVQSSSLLKECVCLEIFTFISKNYMACMMDVTIENIKKYNLQHSLSLLAFLTSITALAFSWW